MFRNRLLYTIRNVYRTRTKNAISKHRTIAPVSLGLLSAVFCNEKHEMNLAYDSDSLEHDFLIRQATTVNVNAATQLLTVTLVAIQDTSER